jgi:hypothetical protein
MQLYLQNEHILRYKLLIFVMMWIKFYLYTFFLFIIVDFVGWFHMIDNFIPLSLRSQLLIFLISKQTNLKLSSFPTRKKPKDMVCLCSMSSVHSNRKGSTFHSTIQYEPNQICSECINMHCHS